MASKFLQRFSPKEKWAHYAALGVVLGLYVYHFSLVCTWAIDLPYMDDWDELARPNLGSWIFGQHNEHRIVTTRITNWAYFHINHWNLADIQIGNFLFYGILLLLTYLFVKSCTSDLPGWLIVLLTGVALSPAAYQNHTWAFQIQWHYVLFFLIWSAWCLFGAQTYWRLLAAALLGVLCIYSLSSGLVSIGVLWLIYSLFKLLRVKNKDFVPATEMLQWALVSAIWALSLVLYLHGYVKPAINPNFVFPWQSAFWDYFFILLAHGFGWDGSTLLTNIAGAAILAALLAPWLILIGRSCLDKDVVDGGKWALSATSLAIVFSLAAITVGRAGFGDHQATASRYTEFVFILMPVTVGLWWCALRNWPRLRCSGTALLSLFCFLALGLQWHYFQAYEVCYQGRYACVANLRGCLLSETACYCPNLHGALPIPVAQLQEAKRLHLAFADNLMAGRDP